MLNQQGSLKGNNTSDQAGLQKTACPTGDSPASQSNQQWATGNDNADWRRIVRNFTPSWFAVSMGTGVVCILLHSLPYNGVWLQYISYTLFCLNIALFSTFLAMSILRYALYPEIWFAMIAHPGQSLFLGCLPMGFATIINMMIYSCKPWGDWLIYLAWAFWWVDCIVAVATCISMPFIVMHRHRPGLDNVTAALLLPIVPVVVAAATGGIVAEFLPNAEHALTTIITSYILWGIGQCLSGIVMALYFHRLTIHSLPPKEAIVSVFLPIGPLGQGGFGIQQLGKVALKVIPQTRVFSVVGLDAERGSEILYVMGVFCALVMWGFGLVWLSFALISIATTHKFPFNMGWWGFTFPIGVLATCTGSLAQNLDSEFFKIATMILSLFVVALWCLVTVRTVKMAITGEIFTAPCLKDLRPKYDAAGSDRRV